MPGFPRPRLTINPALRAVVRACETPGWLLSIQAGLAHHSRFSILINAETVPATATNIKHLEQIAEAVGFDKAGLFVDGER